jgi:hypothetical protein
LKLSGIVKVFTGGWRARVIVQPGGGACQSH